MISVAEALERVLALAAPLETESVPLAHGVGRVLREKVVARRSQPPFAASAMDGYAVTGDAVRPGATFTVIGQAAAGHGFAGRVGRGEAVRIFTGAPLPEGADHVVIQEDVTRQGGNITLLENVGAGANVRAPGCDFRAGAELSAPRRLRPADLALIAAMNVAELHVTRRPVVALIATGDELVMPGEAPGPDQIIASNSFALQAMVAQEGAEARLLPIARDDAESLRTVFALAEGADVIVTIGGASVGDHDLVGPVAQSLGMERAFYKVAMRPGKPLMAGRLGTAALLGLPGNPVSAIICGQLFLLPLLRAMQGLEAGPPKRLRARLACDLPANAAREHYMRARLSDNGGEMPDISPFDSQDSALLSVLGEADALLVRPPEDPPRRAGDTVACIPL